jgi:YVTN family beta-propeller protein
MIKMIILLVTGMCLLTGFVTTTTASTNILVESDHLYANNFNYIWPEISQPEATQMRLHFTKLELDFDDKLTLLDKDGNKLVTFRDYIKDDFWTEWHTGNTIKVKLETNWYDTAYGFKIDQVEIRTNPESISMDINETPSSSSAPLAYITNGDSNNVSVIETATNTVIATVNVSDGPFGVVATSDGKKVYVANLGSNNVSVIDTATNSVTDSIYVGKQPRGIAVSPDGTKIYVVNSASNNVSVIDTVTNNVIATVNVEWIPYGVAVNPDGTKAYVTNGDLGNENNTVSVIDTVSNTVIATVNVGGIPYGVAVTPDGTKVYVANWGSDNVSVIDTATNTITARVNITRPIGITVNPDGKKVYVTNGSSNVSVIDVANNTVIATVNVGSSPFGVAVTPDGKKVYVVNSDSNNVSVIDTATNAVTATVPVGNNPRAFGQFIVGSVTNSTAAAESDCKEIKDYLPVYANGVNLNIINKVGNDILVVWTKADSKEPVFKVNVLNEQTRKVTAPTGSFDEYIRITYPQEVCSWYRVIQTTNGGHTQLESGYEYTVTYYWGSNGTGLTPIPDSEAPE